MLCHSMYSVSTAKLTSWQDGNIRAGFEKAQQRREGAVASGELLSCVEITVNHTSENSAYDRSNPENPQL